MRPKTEIDVLSAKVALDAIAIEKRLSRVEGMIYFMAALQVAITVRVFLP